MGEWAPDYLVRWLIGQGRIWVTADGEAGRIANMHPAHAENAAALLHRNASEVRSAVGRSSGVRLTDFDWIRQQPVYIALRKRAEE